LWQDSPETSIVTYVLQFTIPDVTPGQAFTFNNRFTAEERGTATETVVETFSKQHRVIHSKPPDSNEAITFISSRDIVADHVWWSYGATYVEAMRSCENENHPEVESMIRAKLIALGFVYEPDEEGTGCKITVLSCVDPKGNLPTNVVNVALRSSMVDKVRSFYSYFVEKKGIDGSDNGGVFADDERYYEFKGGVEKSVSKVGKLSNTMWGTAWKTKRQKIIKKDVDDFQGLDFAETTFHGFGHDGKYDESLHTESDKKQTELGASNIERCLQECSAAEAEFQDGRRSSHRRSSTSTSSWKKNLKTADGSPLPQGTTCFFRYDSDARTGMAFAKVEVKASPAQVMGHYQDERREWSDSFSAEERIFFDGTIQLSFLPMPATMMFMSNRESLARGVYKRVGNENEKGIMLTQYEVLDERKPIAKGALRIGSEYILMAREKAGSGEMITELMCYLAIDPKLGGPVALLNSAIAKDIVGFAADPIIKVKEDVERLLYEYEFNQLSPNLEEDTGGVRSGRWRKLKMKLTNKKEAIDGARKFLGVFFLLFGVALVVYLNFSVSAQRALCEQEFSTCAWSKMEHKLYFKNGLLASTVCGFGVDLNQGRESWKLDAKDCGVDAVFKEWRSEFSSLREVDLSGNGISEYPAWFEEESLPLMQTVNLSGNMLTEFKLGPFWVGGNASTSLTLDLTYNAIEDLPLEVMELNAPHLALNFSGNPCAESAAWSGRGLTQLPVRMRNTTK